MNSDRDFAPVIQGGVGFGFANRISSVLGATEHAKDYSAPLSLIYKISSTTIATLTETYYGLTSAVTTDTFSGEQFTLGIRKTS